MFSCMKKEFSQSSSPEMRILKKWGIEFWSLHYIFIKSFSIRFETRKLYCELSSKQMSSYLLVVICDDDMDRFRFRRCDCFRFPWHTCLIHTDVKDRDQDQYISPVDMARCNASVLKFFVLFSFHGRSDFILTSTSFSFMRSSQVVWSSSSIATEE